MGGMFKHVFCAPCIWGGNQELLWLPLATDEGAQAHFESQKLMGFMRDNLTSRADNRLEENLDKAVKELDEYQKQNGLTGQELANQELLDVAEQLEEAQRRVEALKISWWDAKVRLRFPNWCGNRNTHQQRLHLDYCTVVGNKFLYQMQGVTSIALAKEQWKQQEATQAQQAAPTQQAMAAPQGPTASSSRQTACEQQRNHFDICENTQRHLGCFRFRGPCEERDRKQMLIMEDRFSEALANEALAEIVHCAGSASSMQKFAEVMNQHAQELEDAKTPIVVQGANGDKKFHLLRLKGKIGGQLN